jgi:hypothetical protein
MICNQVSESYAKIIDDLRRQITEANLPLPSRMESVKTTTKRALPQP